MNPEQQRIAIAEACGWKFIPEYYHGEDQPPEFTTVTPDGKHLCGYYPDYLNDLNAMHEAEKQLLATQSIMYRLAFHVWPYSWVKVNLSVPRSKSSSASSLSSKLRLHSVFLPLGAFDAYRSRILATGI